MSSFPHVHRFRRELWSKYSELSNASEPLEVWLKRHGVPEAPPFSEYSWDDDELRQNEEYERNRSQSVAKYTVSEGERSRKVVQSWAADWREEIKQLLKFAAHEIAEAGFAIYVEKLEGLHQGFLATVASAERGNCDFTLEYAFSEFHEAEFDYDHIAYLFEGIAEPPRRLQFDQSTCTVKLDGRPFQLGSTTFRILKAIDDARPGKITSTRSKK